MSLAVTGWGMLSSAGLGADAFVSAVAAGRVPASDLGSLYEEPLPAASGHALVGLDPRKILGRKGTGSLDRRTALTLIACRDALEDGEVRIDDETRHRIGVAIGTTWGSVQAMSDYTKESLLEERPYLVDPGRFPNTVMNCAAGQAAIRYGLRGVNATIAGGDLAFLDVLNYTANVLRRGYADVMLAGAVEEFTPHAAWASHLTERARPESTAGEAAVIFVVERCGRVRAEGRRVDAEFLAVATGFAPGGAEGGRLTEALTGCIRRALAAAGVEPEEVSRVAICGTGDEGDDAAEVEALAAVWDGSPPSRLAPRRIFGDCQAATGALQAATLLAMHQTRSMRDGEPSLFTAWTAEGGVGAAVMRGWSRDGADRS